MEVLEIARKREAIRADILKQRQNLASVERAMHSKKIVTHVIEWIEENEKNVKTRSFDAVMVYFSMKSEVETDELIQRLLRQGKQIIAPCIKAESPQLMPRQIQDVEQDLVRHSYGMLQPKETCPTYAPNQLELIIVPGIAFDLNGYRLGYGKGYYDRFLVTCPNAATISIAYEVQLVPNTYPQPWDIPVQHIFTENGKL